MGLSDDLKKSIASSIAAMAVEISRLEMVLIMECEGVPCAGVCSVPGNLLVHVEVRLTARTDSLRAQLPKQAYYFSEHLSQLKHNILSYFLEQIIAIEMFYKGVYLDFQKIS